MARLPPCVEFDDLVQEGHIGALIAHTRFQDTVARFQSYATHRVRGAMLDYLRSIDPLSRKQRRDSKGEQVHVTASPPDRQHAFESETPEHDLAEFDDEMVEPVEVELPGTAKRIQQALAKLTANEQYVIRAEFWQDASQESTARALGVTPSRVCQLRKQALVKLRRTMEVLPFADAR